MEKRQAEYGQYGKERWVNEKWGRKYEEMSRRKWTVKKKNSRKMDCEEINGEEMGSGEIVSRELWESEQ